MDVMTRIEQGGVVLLDGAMGTELERRGVPMHHKAWSAAAMGTHPEIVCQIHGDYVHAGAEIHIVNSFALGRPVLEPAGLGDHFEDYNHAAVELCREAIESAGAGRPQWLAGSLSSFAVQSDRSNLPQGAALRAAYDDQSRVLQAAGVDLFALEMLCDVAISTAALEAAAATGLPVMIGFTCMWGEDGKTVETIAGDVGLAPLSLDEALPAVLAAVPPGTPAIVAVMHCEFDVTDAALEVVARHWSGPLAVYPNSGGFVFPNWQFDTVCTPRQFVEAARRWIAAGAGIVGGCCGIGPAHIRALRAHLG